MTTIVPRFATCNKCGGRTPVHFIGSTNVRKTDSDFCPWSMGYQPLDYALSVCPKCNFVGRPDEFYIEQGEFREDHPYQHWEETERPSKEYPMSKRFVSYAQRIEQEGASYLRVGEAFLHGSWAERKSASPMNRSAESIALEGECQQNAAKYFELGLQKGTLPPSPENLYLIGELHRRIGDFSKASEYFDNATIALENKYYILILEDAGPQSDIVEAIVLADSSIEKAGWIRILNSIPCEILSYLTFEKVQERVTRLSALGATVSIKEQVEELNRRNEIMDLIRRMKEFAIQGDSDNKIADEKYSIYIY